MIMQPKMFNVFEQKDMNILPINVPELYNNHSTEFLFNMLPFKIYSTLTTDTGGTVKYSSAMLSNEAKEILYGYEYSQDEKDEVLDSIYNFNRYITNIFFSDYYKVDKSIAYLLPNPVINQNDNKNDRFYFLKLFVNQLEFNNIHPVILTTEFINKDFMHMNSKELKETAEKFKQYIFDNQDKLPINKIIIPTSQFAQYMFPEIAKQFKSASNKLYYKVFNHTFHHRGKKLQLKIMIAPSPMITYQSDERVFNMLAEYIDILNNFHENKEEFKIIRITDMKSLDHWLNLLKNKAIEENRPLELALDLETSGLWHHAKEAKILSAAFSNGKAGWWFTVEHPLEKKNNTDLLKALCTDERIDVFILQNGVFDLKWLRSYGINIPYRIKLMDTKRLDHALNESLGSLANKLKTGIFSMEKQIVRYLYHEPHKSMVKFRYSYLDLIKNFNPSLVKKNIIPSNYKDIRDISVFEAITYKLENPVHESGQFLYATMPINLLGKYNAIDTIMTFRIYKKMMERVFKEWGEVPFFIDPIHDYQTRLISEMLNNGAKLDYDFTLDQLKKAFKLNKKYYDKLLKSIDIDLWKKVNKNKFNLQSHAQLIEYLIALGVEREDFLEEIVQYKINNETSYIEAYSELRKLFYQVKNTKDFKYAEKLNKRINEILKQHPEFNKLNSDKSTLKNIMNKYDDLDLEWLEDYIKYSELNKAITTYLTPFIVKSNGGRIYYEFQDTGTTSGRLSSSNPNFQNLPKTFLKGNETIYIKQCIEATEDYNLVEADFSSLEVKVLTAYAQDENLIKAIKEGLDLHSYTASLITGVPYETILSAKKRDDAGEEISEEEKEYLHLRSKAKRAVFGSIYGISAQGLALQIKKEGQDLNDAIKEAGELLDIIVKRAYPEISKWFVKTHDEVYLNGYVETKFRRRRRFFRTIAYKAFDFIKYLDNHFNRENLYLNFSLSFFKNGKHLAMSEYNNRNSLLLDKRPLRQSINHLVQSLGSDIVFFASYHLRRAIDDKNPSYGRFLFTVHDSVVLELNETKFDNKEIEEMFKYAWWDVIQKELVDKGIIPVNIGFAGEISKRYTGDILHKFSYGY